MGTASGRAGRPSKYEAAFVAQAEEIAKLGATDLEIARFFRIGTRTFYDWRTRHPDFAAALVVGKEVADARVERSLYQRAVGYSYEEIKTKTVDGKEHSTRHVVHFPPDVTACIYWTKNRRPDLWRDRHDHEVGGKDGKPIQVTISAIEDKF